MGTYEIKAHPRWIRRFPPSRGGGERRDAVGDRAAGSQGAACAAAGLAGGRVPAGHTRHSIARARSRRERRARSAPCAARAACRGARRNGGSARGRAGRVELRATPVQALRAPPGPRCAPPSPTAASGWRRTPGLSEPLSASGTFSRSVCTRRLLLDRY